MRIKFAAFCWLALLGAACDDLSTATSPSETATIDVNSFSSSIAPGSAASREFTLTTGGTLSLTLTATTPPGVPLGVGIGIPRSSGSCAVSQGVQTVAGSAAQIALSAEAATYCAKVYDPGTLTEATSFTIVLSRP